MTELDCALRDLHIFEIKNKILKPCFVQTNVALFVSFFDDGEEEINIWTIVYDKISQSLRFVMQRNLDAESTDSQTYWTIDSEVQSPMIQQIIMTQYYGLPNTVVNRHKKQSDNKDYYQIVLAFNRINLLNKIDEEKQHNLMKFYLDRGKLKKLKYAPDSNLNEAFLDQTSNSMILSIDSLETDDQDGKKIGALHPTITVTGTFRNLTVQKQEMDPTLYPIEVKFQIDHHTILEKIQNAGSQPRKFQIIPLPNYFQRKKQNWPFAGKQKSMLAACFFEDKSSKILKLSLVHIFKANEFEISSNIQIMHEKPVMTSFPLLAHVGPQPLANQLYVANLVQNKPQQKIDLSPHYKFVCFFEPGTHSPHAFEDMMTQSIFFLARQRNQKYSVLYINQNPWFKEQKSKIFVSVSDLELPMLNCGSSIKHAMLFKNSFSKRTTLFVKSIINLMFSHEGGNKNVKEILPLITQPKIDWLQFIICDSKYHLVVYDPKEEDKTLQFQAIQGVVPTQAVAGYNQNGYYVKYNLHKDCYQLILVNRGPPDDKVVHKPVYESKVQIIYIQEYNTAPINIKGKTLKLILLDFDFNIKLLHFSETGESFVMLSQVQLRKNHTYSFNFFNNLREQHIPQNIVVEPEVITAASYMFQNKGTHLTRLSIVSENLIQGIDVRPSDLSLEPRIEFMTQMPQIGKEMFLINNKKKNSFYFLIQDKGNQRHIDFMDIRNTFSFINKVHMTEHRIFILCDHSRSLNFILTEQYCIELDRQSTMLVNCYKDVCQIKISTPTPTGPEYVMLLDKLKKKVVTIRCDKICQDCTPYSSVINGNFDLHLEIKQIEETERRSNQKPNRLINGNYIFTENGSTIYVYVLRKEGDQFVKQTQRQKQSKKIEITKLYGTQQVKDVFRFEGEIFDTLENTSSSVKNKFFVLMTSQYIVLRVGCRIIYFHKNQLLKDQSNRPRHAKYNSDDSELGKSFGKKFVVKNVSEIPIVNLNSWEKAKSALQIFNFQSSAVKFFDSGERSSDLIQITMQDQIIIWNLRKNEEVATKSNFEKFCNVDSYVDQGITLFRSVQKKVPQTGLQYFHMLPFQSNKQRSAYMIPANLQNDQLGVYFKTFTRMAIIETMLLQGQKDEDRSVEKVAHSSLVSDVYGVTIFEKLFDSNIPELAVTRLTDKTEQTIICQLILRPTTDKFKLCQTDHFDDRISSKGMRPKFRRNIMQRCLQFLVISEEIEAIDKQTRRAEMFLELFANQEHIDLSDIISSVSEFWQLYYTMADLKGAKLFTMRWRRRIMFGSDTYDVQWLKDKKMISFGAFSSDINESEIRRQIKSKQTSSVDLVIASVKSDGLNKFLRKLYSKIQKIKWFRKKYVVTEVRVRKYKIDWLRNDEKSLYKLVAESDDTDLFGDVFICDLFLNNDLSKSLFSMAMLPFLIQMSMTLYFYIKMMGAQEVTSPEKYFTVWSVIFVMMAWLIYLELEQMKQYGLLYFSDFWNLLNFTSNGLVVIVFYCDFTGKKGIQQALCASISGFLLSIQLFYWTQMFKNISMYFRIILDSVLESRFFLMMVLVLLISFSNAAYILDSYQQNLFDLRIEPVWSEQLQSEDYIKMTLVKTGNENIDSFFTQYLLMLGEFEILELEGMETYPLIVKILLWCYFFLATFMTQVVFFNVLVAVIGESYAEKWADKDKYALQQTATIYSDYITNLNTKMPPNQFIYIVQPQNQEDLEQHTRILNSITALVRENSDTHDNQVCDLNQRLEMMQKSQENLKKELKEDITSVQVKIDKVLSIMDKRAQNS